MIFFFGRIKMWIKLQYSLTRWLTTKIKNNNYFTFSLAPSTPFTLAICIFLGLLFLSQSQFFLFLSVPLSSGLLLNLLSVFSGLFSLIRSHQYQWSIWCSWVKEWASSIKPSSISRSTSNLRSCISFVKWV